MPSTPRIRQSPGNRNPEQLETRARDGRASTSPDTMTTSGTSGADASAAAAPALEDGYGDARDDRPVPEVDRALVDAMAFFDDPAAEPQLPSEQMIYTPTDDVYVFREFPELPVIPASLDQAWRAVQLNLTHDGALGAALVTLAADKAAFGRALQPSERPGHYLVRLKLPAQGGRLLDVTAEVDARVPGTEAGHLLGAIGSNAFRALWPLVMAKGIGKLVRVLRASGHLPPYSVKPSLPHADFHMWLTGRAPQPVTRLRDALTTLARNGSPAMVLQVPNVVAATSIRDATVTPALGGMAHRLRGGAGEVDALLLNGHHYGVVAAGPKNVTLYNPLGFNPSPSLADRPDRGFFDPHSLGSAGKADATISLPAAWLRAIGCAWFL